MIQKLGNNEHPWGFFPSWISANAHMTDFAVTVIRLLYFHVADKHIYMLQTKLQKLAWLKLFKKIQLLWLELLALVFLLFL